MRKEYSVGNMYRVHSFSSVSFCLLFSFHFSLFSSQKKMNRPSYWCISVQHSRLSYCERQNLHAPLERLPVRDGKLPNLLPYWMSLSPKDLGSQLVRALY